MSEEGITRSAVLLMALGEDTAAEVLKHLAPREVQKLGEAIARLGTVSRARIGEVIEAFCGEAAQQGGVALARDEYLKSVLTKALGAERASALIERILHGEDASGIEGLKWLDAATVAELIKNEHPQVIATILVHLDSDHASEVLAQFPERLRNDVALRIATLDGVQPAALRDLNEVLTRLLTGSDRLKKTAMGGVRATAEILNNLPGTMETSVLDAIREHDPQLAQSILDEMFVFEDLMTLDDRAVQLLLREVQSETLIVALKGAGAELREKIFRNMSQRAAETLREDLEAKGPVRVSEVEAQQKEILKIVRRLAEEGQIALGKKAEEAYV
jgi:flagellar motor switch protein FliG